MRDTFSLEDGNIEATVDVIYGDVPDSPASQKPSSSSSSSMSVEVEELNDDSFRCLLKKPRSSNSSDSGSLSSDSFKAVRRAVHNHELPMRMAYEQLNELAANAERVKLAIEKNRSLLTLQVKRDNMRYMRSAFIAWKVVAERRHLSRQHSLSRAFEAWRMVCLENGKVARLQASVEKILNRHTAGRIWKAWYNLVKNRLLEEDKDRNERKIIRDIEKTRKRESKHKAIRFLHRRRLARSFYAFKVGVALKKEKVLGQQQLVFYLLRKKMRRALFCWILFTKQESLFRKAVDRIQKNKLSKCFLMWLEALRVIQYCCRRLNKCRLRFLFASWVDTVYRAERYREIFSRCKLLRLRTYFLLFKELCLNRKRNRRIVHRALLKFNFVRLKSCFQAWVWYMQIQANKKMMDLQEYVTNLEGERDRLAKIVECGDFSNRITELEQASQVLSEERSALLELIGHLQQRQPLASDQEHDVKNIKDQIMGNNFMLRNKMLIKGASSFNSLVRAIKSDVLKRGVDPELLYKVDNMSMDQVSVFPDGDIRVKPLSKFDKGKWISRTTSDATKAFIEGQPIPCHNKA